LFPPDRASRHETPMLLYALGFYGCYAVGVAGLVPMWAAGIVGVIALVRFFNQAHEMMHADAKGERAWHPARAMMIIMGPIYLGYRELRESHLLHHREEGSPRDPDLLDDGRVAGQGGAVVRCCSRSCRRSTTSSGSGCRRSWRRGWSRTRRSTGR
jgi:fatty acid desaturase